MKSNAIATATSSTTTQRVVSRALTGRPTRFGRSRLAGTSPYGRPAGARGSRVLEDHALDQVRHILAAVGDGFQLLVNRLELDELAHVVFFTEEPGHRGTHDTIGVRLEPVDLFAGLDRRLGGLVIGDARQQGHGMLHTLTAFRAHVAEPNDVVV